MNDIKSTPSAPNARMVTITIQIPEHSEAAFDKLVEAWCAGVLGACATRSGSGSPTRDELLSAATEWWRSLNSNERSIWNLWIDEAPHLVPATKIVNALGLRSPSSIKGVVNRMAGKGSNVGFQVGWQSHRVDPITKERLYGVRDFGTGAYPHDEISVSGEEYAELLRDARSAAESR